MPGNWTFCLTFLRESATRMHYAARIQGQTDEERETMPHDVHRRDFLQALGITVGAAALGATGGSTAPNQAEAQAKAPPKGSIPDKPIKIGHMTFFTGPGAVLGEPSYKGTSWLLKRSTPRVGFWVSGKLTP
jgi:hypothetical protein